MFLTIIKHENVTEPNLGGGGENAASVSNQLPRLCWQFNTVKSPLPLSSHIFRKEALTLQMLSSLSDPKDE